MFKRISLVVFMAISFLCNTGFADVRGLVVNQQGSIYKPTNDKEDLNDFQLMTSIHFLGTGVVSGVGAFKAAKYSKENLVNGFRLGYQGFRTASPLMYRRASTYFGKGIVTSGVAATFGLVSLLGLELGGAGLYLYAVEKDK